MRSALSTLTTRGRAFLSAGITAAVCAIVLGQKDLLRVGMLLIALPVITALVANRVRYLLSCSREVTPTRVQAGQSATVSLHLQNPGRVPTGLMLLEDQVPYVLGSRPRFVLDQLRPRWQRSMAYTVRSEVRGRYSIGPLTVRLSDPFGFIELNRAFTARASLVVTPVVTELPLVQLSGDWSGTGDNRPRAFAAAGTEDITVREYRMGDDLRRIHWRSTARADELMVRREEQPSQSRATVMIDTRDNAHRGSGPASSFEFAVSAAASIGAHLAGQGFTLRMLTDEARGGDATWHDRGTGSGVEVQLLLDSLAVISTSSRNHIADASVERNASGLVIAVLGETSRTDVAALSTLRVGASRALAIVVDVAAWARSGRPADITAPSADEQAKALRQNGWAVVVARPGDRLPAIWKELGTTTATRRDFVAEAREAEEGPAA